MKIRTRTFTEPTTAHIPGLDSDSLHVNVWPFKTARTWRRRELVVGRKVFPLGNWRRV